MRISMLSASLMGAGSLFPETQRQFWRWWYNRLAERDGKDLLLMNYGYWDAAPVTLEADEEKHRYALQLYRYLLKETDLQGKILFEAGSGRGGGLHHIHRTCGPKYSIGLDFAMAATSRAQEELAVEGLQYLCADVERIPLANGSVDVAINVESSHCYPNMVNFVTEIARILKADGRFLFCDFRDRHNATMLHQQLANESGFKLIRREVLNENVLKALDRVCEQRLHFLETHVPRSLKLFFKHFAAVPGSNLYLKMQNGDVLYLLYELQKPSLPG